MPPHDPVTFSVGEIPFSYHCSWLNLSVITAENQVDADVHLVSHQTGLHPILALSPQRAGERLDTTVIGTSAVLTWSEKRSSGPVHDRGDLGEMQATFEAGDTIRVRGRGLDLRLSAASPTLTPFSGSYFFVDPIDGTLTYTSYETGRRYRITVLAGRCDVFGDQALGAAERGALIAPDVSGSWELAVEEFETSRETYTPEASFADIVSAAAHKFQSFLDDTAPWRSERTPAAGHAAYVLWSATVGPAGFLQRQSVLMSKHWMDKVWSWDHCFNALALAGGRPELAVDQFLIPFDHQDERGALPDSVTHSEVLYNFVKPPIHGWALQGLRRRLSVDLDRQQLVEIYTLLARWTMFWLDGRRAPGHRLAHYQHGNDSGWDNATTFDAFRVVESADLAGFLYQQLTVLADLALELDLSTDGDRWRAEATQMRAALLDELWDGERFTARDPITGTRSTSESLLNLLPLALGDRLPTEVADKLAAALRQHLTAWGLATELPTSPEYRSDGYWRGPIWAPSTILLEDGVRRAGHADLADEISTRFLRLCEKSGFAENFDAVTGDGLRDRAYTWTASAYLLLAADHEDRRRSERQNLATSAS